MRITFYASLILAALTLAIAPPAHAQIELRAANVHGPNLTQTLALRKWSELLDEATGGEITVRVFDSGTIVSNQQDAYGQVKIGTVDAVLSVAVENDVPALQIPFFPFAFDSYEEWRAFMDSEHMQALYDEFLEKTGIRILGIQYIGSRHLTANKPIYRPADLGGMKIRAP
jgi:TRAP-type C4-dicarboxylate transport system substrate-binding protein